MNKLNPVSKKTVKDILALSLITVLLTVLIWLPYLLKLNFYGLNFSEGFNTIYKNYDGINYIVIAKSFYFPELIDKLPNSLSSNYYAAHFPGFPLLILVFAPFLGFLKSMVFVSALFTMLSAIAFYLLVKNFNLTRQPLILSLIFLILPARWLVVHSVGSAEPIFIFFTIAALYYFMKYEEMSKPIYIALTGIFGLFAQLTRPPGILLFIALSLYILFRILKSKDQNIFKRFFKAISNYYLLLLIPLSLILVFSWYIVSYRDFFAYFKSGDNIHLTFPPYQVFNVNQYWVGSIWLEDIIYIFTFAFLGVLLLFKQKIYPLAFYALVYLGATILVAHRDISRYLLPIFPLILIAFEKVLVTKEFKIVLLILIWGIYLYTQNFILQNTAPIPNLEIFN